MIAFVARPSDATETLFVLAILAVVYGVFGIVCALMAPSRGRSPVGWFFIGVVTQCLGIILILLLPNLKVEEEKRRRHDEETRRLREQLKKERQVADDRHSTHRQRIDVHDRALGVDTAAAEVHQLTGSPPPPPLPLPAPPETMWFFAHLGARHGPVPASRLRQLFLDGDIDSAALVWREGMRDWVEIMKASDLLPEEEP